MTEFSIGVDLGGTNLRAAAICRDGKLLSRVEGSTPVGGGRDAVVEDMVQAIKKLQSELSDGKLCGVGVGVPGYVLMEKGIVLRAPNLPEFENYPVRDEIEQRLGAKVTLENDANAAALGEHWIGAGRGVCNLILLTLGTGIGSGIISDNKVMHGYLGMAGEIGHMTLTPSGYPCGCGNTGCFEKYASATAVSAMAKMLNLGQNLTSLEVYHLAKSGNERALSVFDSLGVALGAGITSLMNIFNFPLYLLGGGLTAAWDLFQPAMLEELSRRSFVFRTTPPKIERASLGSDAGLYGAAKVAL